jgi:hypothetical protein
MWGKLVVVRRPITELTLSQPDVYKEDVVNGIDGICDRLNNEEE